MKLTNIVNLYNEMKEEKLYRQRFEFEYNKVKADVFFLTDNLPFILLFGVKTKNIYFEIEVQRGFYIRDSVDNDKYSKMCIAFNIQYGQSNTFRPIDLFTTFNNQIPQKLSNTKKARPSDLIQYKRPVEEADKTYFWRFRNNNGYEHVTEKNLEKTRLLMGEEAYERCKKENISTQWTDDPSKDNFDNWKIL